MFPGNMNWLSAASVWLWIRANMAPIAHLRVKLLSRLKIDFGGRLILTLPTSLNWLKCAFLNIVWVIGEFMSRNKSKKRHSKTVVVSTHVRCGPVINNKFPGHYTLYWSFYGSWWGSSLSLNWTINFSKLTQWLKVIFNKFILASFGS